MHVQLTSSVMYIYQANLLLWVRPLSFSICKHQHLKYICLCFRHATTIAEFPGNEQAGGNLGLVSKHIQLPKGYQTACTGWQGVERLASADMYSFRKRWATKKSCQNMPKLLVTCPVQSRLALSQHPCCMSSVSPCWIAGLVL